jgi:hypothetical protein
MDRARRPPLKDISSTLLAGRSQSPGPLTTDKLKWLGRLLLEEGGVTLSDAHVAAAGLAALTRDRDVPALAAFVGFCEAQGLARAARALDALISQPAR